MANSRKSQKSTKRRKTVSRKAHHRDGYFRPGDFLNWVSGTDVKKAKSRKPKAHNRKAHSRKGYFRPGDFLNWVSGGPVHSTKVRAPSSRKEDRQSRYKRRPNSRKSKSRRKRAVAYRKKRQGVVGGTVDAFDHTARTAWDTTGGRLVHGKRAVAYKSSHKTQQSHKGKHSYREVVKHNMGHARQTMINSGKTGRDVSTGAMGMLGKFWQATKGEVLDMGSWENTNGKVKPSQGYARRASQSSRKSRSRKSQSRRGKHRGIIGGTVDVVGNTTRSAWDETDGRVIGAVAYKSSRKSRSRKHRSRKSQSRGSHESHEAKHSWSTVVKHNMGHARQAMINSGKTGRDVSTGAMGMLGKFWQATRGEVLDMADWEQHNGKVKPSKGYSHEHKHHYSKGVCRCGAMKKMAVAYRGSRKSQGHKHAKGVGVVCVCAVLSKKKKGSRKKQE